MDGSISSAASVYGGVVVASVFPPAVVVGVFLFFWAFYAPLRCPLILICLGGGGGKGRQDEPSKVDSQNEIERSKKK